MKNRLRSLYVPLVLIAVLSLAVLAFQVGEIDEDAITKIISGIISFAVLWLGPRPLKYLYDLIGLGGGAQRVLATYIVSGILGAVALLATGAFDAISWDLETVMAFAGALATSAQMAYHRLKDLYGSSLQATP